MKKEIVNRYKWHETLDMVMEECGELIHACNKYKRARGIGYATLTTEEESLAKLVQAIADSVNSIESAMYALNIRIEEMQKCMQDADEKMESVCFKKGGETAYMSNWKKDFCKERREMALSHDPQKVREFLRKYNPQSPAIKFSDFGLIEGTHKLVCNLPGMPEEEKEFSKTWLMLNGIKETIE